MQNTPRIAVRQALTSGTVNDGESLVVRGFLQETKISQLRKVPGLGEVPVTPHVLSNKSLTK